MAMNGEQVVDDKKLSFRVNEASLWNIYLEHEDVTTAAIST